MNKQKLIDKYTAEISRLRPYCPNRHLISEQLKYDLYKEILEDLKQLDEPQKHVMPKFFDDWAKRVIAKHDEFYAISLVARAGWGYGVDFELSEKGSSSENKELLYWLVDKCSDNYPNKKKAIEALLYGYEVEKIQKYIVKIGKLYLKEPLGDTSNSTILTTWDKKCAYPFSSFHMADKHADKFEGAVVEVVEG